MNALLIVAVSSATLYAFLILVGRLIGRRALAQLSALDLLVVMLLGSAVETSLIHGNTSLRAGLVSGSVLLLMNGLLTAVMLRSPKLRHLVGAGPLLLVHNGVPVDEHLKRAGLTHQDLMEAIREREFTDLADVRLAVMEPDGRINVVPYPQKQTDRTPPAT